ncbi:DUF2156 domain-containing protein [bacterium]|nr:MAG: DUF2156 domain-containing protein [bacterium]
MPPESRARELVLRFGWNTTCYQILNPGMRLWFSQDREAVVGYVGVRGVRVVAGAPVCRKEDLAAVLDEWHAEADATRERVCYFGAEARLRETIEGQTGYSTVALGAQPVWEPGAFGNAIAANKKLRYQLARARNKGVAVEEWPAERGDDPALWRILERWLASRGLPAMHFLVEPETLRHLMDRRLFVAIHEGEPVGFVVMTPIPARNGWLTEQFPRQPGAPNGTVDLTLATAVEAVGASMVTMGIVPLSQRSIPPHETLPAWLRWSMRWARAHGRRFYDWEGLDRFKDKFRPDRWEPIYAVSREKTFSPGTLLAIGEAFAGRSPLPALGASLLWAARRELEGRA